MEQKPNQVKTLNKEINNIVNNNFQVTTDDTDAIAGITVTWDDLNELKNNISQQIMEFVESVTSITTNIDLLKVIDDKSRFERLVEIFYKDVNDYTTKFKNYRLRHEHKTGKILSLEEYEEFNNLAFAYYGLSEELITLLTPTVTDILVTCNVDISSVQNESMESLNG